jgi:acetyl-CoA synthetase
MRNGYVRFIGRDDDVITSSGYRIGPGEIEDCLLKHEAVSLAAVVGKPDRAAHRDRQGLRRVETGRSRPRRWRAELQAFVRKRLSAHEYPREIAFATSCP